MTVFLVLLALVVFVAVEAIRIRLGQRQAETGRLQPVQAFSDIRLPQGLFVGNNHSWARLTGQGELKIGMDELLVQAVGGVDRVDLPKIGETVNAGQTLATVWRGGRSLKITSPVAGTVVTHNSNLGSDGSVITEDPYGSGWIASVWPEDVGEALGSFRVGAKSINWMRHETQRFCDFMADHAVPESVGAVLADGAHPVVGAAQSLDDQAWLVFESAFAN
jgi:glycine cleavage system H protein